MKTKVIVVFGILLLFMSSSICWSQDIFVTPKLMDEKLASLNEYENRRFMEIIVLVAKDSDMPKPSTKIEFRAMLGKMQLSKDQREGLKNTIIASNIYMIRFWQDALKSLELGRHYRSKSRLILEGEMLNKGLLRKERQEENNAMMEKIASGIPVETEQGTIVFDKRLIEVSLSNTKAALARFNQLFSED
jgi:hypothetical protein